MEIYEHLCLKLMLNTLSTGVMARMGRIHGNWMTCMAISNKKLMDRGARIVSDLCGVPYEQALAVIDGWKEKYKDHMEDDVLVKEVIANMQLVDREKLTLYESIANPSISALEKEMKDALKDFELQPQTATS